jgi:hypothetical protein
MAGLALLAAGWGVNVLFLSGRPNASDIPVYADDAARFLHGHLPYASVAFEYPPLAAPLFAAGGLLGTGYSTYRLVFSALMFAFGAVALVLVGKLASETGGIRSYALLVLAVTPVVLGSLVGTHFDAAPVALMLGALLAIARGRTAIGFALLGAAALTKGFPLIGAPAALAWLVARGQRHLALRGAGVLAATLLVGVGIALAVSPSGAAAALRFQVNRPTQVESSPAMLARAVGELGGPVPRIAYTYRSHATVGGVAASLGTGFTIALVGVVFVLAAGAIRDPSPRGVVLAVLTSVLAYVALGKVLSPQFMLWTAPLCALALAWRMRAASLALALATLLTRLEFPTEYANVLAGKPFALALLGTRDALLVVALGLLARSLSFPAPRRGREVRVHTHLGADRAR